MKSDALVSIIIPTFNEEKNIGRQLVSIRHQNYKHVEIIIVDQSSEDKTVAIATEYQAKVISLKRPSFYSPPGKNRNIGAKEASGDIYIHLDADMELPHKNFLQILLQQLDDKHEAVIIHEMDITNGFWSTCKALERRCYWGTKMESARAVTKKLFWRINGYNENISSGEDFYISNLYSKYTTITSDEKLYINHYIGSMSLLTMINKKYNYGKTADKYLSATKKDSSAKMNIIAISLRSYLRNYKFLFSDPLHYIGFNILRVLEYSALSFGRLSTYLKLT